MSRARGYFFTYNNYTEEDVKTLIEFASQEQLEYVFQEEKGEETNCPHLQGLFYSKTKMYFNKLKDSFPKVHWEVIKHKKKAIAYCTKTETRVGKVYTNMKIMIPEVIRDPLADVELYDYQAFICNLVNTIPDSRTIFWFHDKEGRRGKTALAKHLCLINSRCIYLSGKTNDCKYSVSEFITRNKVAPTICIFDFVRSVENFVSYDAIESIKNGIFFSGKYESKQQIFNPPHVICFANFAPDMNALSKDRWVIRCLHSDRLDKGEFIGDKSPPRTYSGPSP